MSIHANPFIDITYCIHLNNFPGLLISHWVFWGRRLFYDRRWCIIFPKCHHSTWQVRPLDASTHQCISHIHQKSINKNRTLFLDGFSIFVFPPALKNGVATQKLTIYYLRSSKMCAHCSGVAICPEIASIANKQANCQELSDLWMPIFI